MADIITISCPNCNTKLNIKNIGINQFICNTCGHEYLIKREGGITYLEDIEPSIDFMEENTKTNVVQDIVFNEDTEDDLGIEDLTMGIEYQQPFTNPHLVDIVKSEPLLDKKNNAEQIDKKISKLQILQNRIQQNYAKSKVTYTVLCLVFLVIIYALFPIFDSYNDLFIAMGITFIPVILGFVILFLKHRKVALSNINFIETVIINLQQEKNALE